MKRPALVIGSAVALILLSLTQIIMALLMGLAAAVEHKHEIPGAPQVSPALFYGACIFFLGLAIWGCVTSIGLFKLRRWARVSILIIGGCMAFTGVMSAAAMLIALAAFSAAAPAGAAGGPGSPAMTKVVFGVIALLYAAIAGIGIFWLVYFNRKAVRAVFDGGLEASAEGRRPILISVYAVLSLLGALALLVVAFLPLPTVLYGVAFQGWKKVTADLLFAAISVAVGIGLWKLAEWARRLALGYLAVGGTMMVVYLIRPSLLTRNNDAVARAMGVAPAPLPGHVQTVMYGFIFGISLLFMAAIAWMLHYYRDRFATPPPAATITGV